METPHSHKPSKVDILLNLGIICSVYYLLIIATIFGILVSELDVLFGGKEWKSYMGKVVKLVREGRRGVDPKNDKDPSSTQVIESEKTWSLPKFS